MKVEKKEIPISTRKLKPIKREPEEPMKTGSISTRDLDEDRKLKRSHLLAQATEEELDDLWKKIEPRIRFENEIVVARCSRPACRFTLRIQRKKVGMACPNCGRRAYSVAGEEFEPDGQLEELRGKELSDFLKTEKANMESEAKSLRESQEASAILFKAGIRK